MAGNVRNYTTDSRMLLGKQPARTLLIDVSHPLTGQLQIIDNLTEALENLFAIACSLGGPTRIPLFSLISLTRYPEILLPLSHVKNNYARIYSAFQDLKGICYDNSQIHMQSDRRCITQGLQEACCQFRRQIQTGGFCHQLEAIIISCQSGYTIQKQIEEISNTLDLESLKRIQVVSLCSGADFSPWEDLDQNSSQNSLMSNISNNSSLTAGLTDIITLDTDSLSLQNFFHTWLLDNGTDSEHLHIVIPSVCQGTPELTVKCDLHDRILNPAQLPFYGQFTVHPDSATMKTFPTTSKALGMSIPVYKIIITNLIPVANFCDSVVFGMPMIAQPTSCWKIDWDELEKNQQIFRALCKSLLDKDLAMIGQLENVQVKKQGNKEQTSENPQGCFVLLAAPIGALLVKSVDVRELLLPCQAGTGLDGYTEETVTKVTSSLEQLEVLETFNPFLVSSNLYSCLKSKQKRYDPLPPKRRTDLLSDTTHLGNNKDVVGTEGTVRPKNYAFSNSQIKRLSSSTQQVAYPRNIKRTKEKTVLPFPTDL